MSASLTLDKITKVSGEVKLIGSKSLTNRALLLAALSEGTTKLTNILRSDDSEVMIAALKRLGVQIQEDESDNTSLSVTGLGGLFSNENEEVIELFLGNAGTAMRPLCAALALSDGCYKLTGEPRMYERPIGVLVDALRALGAHIEYLGNEGYPPLLIKGLCQVLREHKSGIGSFVSSMSFGAAAAVGSPKIFPYKAKFAAELSGSSDFISRLDLPCEVAKLEVAGNTSSQFISALLMIGSLIGRKLVLEVKGELISKPYVNLTCELLKRFGVLVKNNDCQSFEVCPQHLQSPGSYLVEGDASGATYFLAAAAIAGEVKVTGFGSDSIQGDALFVDVLKDMGAIVEKGSDYIKVSSSGKLRGVDIDMNDMPDAAMTLVPMAMFTSSPIIIRNIESWRVKETDRIAAMANEMRKLGCDVYEGRDFIKIDANVPNVQNVKEAGTLIDFDTYNDHRMAMCMSLIALDRTVVINDPDCCKKTFPDYFERLASVSVRD
ncbi:3-phosphoshikimate 1-carboxyvinyltransferase [uncultured Anaerobiospirillum sp.]|uniref:3-phosphoshikimate 1-carboxyvinyltransferase n=1 Tax=uncultured Anaerobiospirillum sp. TaxID=265728 RepID=UPI0028062D63|nr:3-phosphoshikimate 1-carboxyvinyltransferase [uncultured Anaerobiospirillum sp.]